MHACKNKRSSFTTPETWHGWVSRDGIITFPYNWHTQPVTRIFCELQHIWGAHLSCMSAVWLKQQHARALCDNSSCIPMHHVPFPARRVAYFPAFFRTRTWQLHNQRCLQTALDLSFFLTWTLFPFGKPLQLSPTLTSAVLQQGKRVVKALDFGPISQTLLIKKEMMNSVYVRLARVLSTVTDRAEGTATVMFTLLLCCIPVVIKKNYTVL